MVTLEPAGLIVQSAPPWAFTVLKYQVSPAGRVHPGELMVSTPLLYETFPGREERVEYPVTGQLMVGRVTSEPPTEQVPVTSGLLPAVHPPLMLVYAGSNPDVTG